MANLLSDNAVREIRQIGLEVKALKQKFGTIPTRPNQRRYQIFAEIDSHIADETYTADEVIADSNGILGTTPGNPIRWDNDSTGVGYLYAVDDTSGDATGIFPVFPYSDGEDTFWGFKTHPEEEFQHVFKVTANSDETSVDIGKRRGDSDYQFTDTITIFSGRDGDMETIEKTTTENVPIVAGTNHIYYEINNGTSEVWDATAKSSDTWPPSDIKDDQQKIGWLVAEVDVDGTDITIGQEVFHNPHFYPKPFLPSFSPVQTDENVKITDGRVNLASGSVTITESTFSTTSVLYIYVEITSNNGDTTPTVNPSLQTSATEPTYSEEDSSGNLVRRYVIGKCTGTGNVYQPYHVGDLNLGTLYQPDFTGDMTGDDPTEGYFLGCEDATSIGADKNVFLKARRVLLDFEGGELEDNVDDGTAYFGGDTTDRNQDVIVGASFADGTNLVFTTKNFEDDIQSGLVQTFATTDSSDITVDLSSLIGTGDTTSINQGYVSSVDTDTTEVVFKKANLFIDVDDGLIQTLSVGAEFNEAVLSAGEEWLHIEPGAKVKHVNPDITGDTDTRHWGTLSYDGTTATWDPREGATLTGTDFEIKFDTRKHGYSVYVDGTESTDPEDQTNYKYRDCEDSASFIVCPTETDKIFRKDGLCWEPVGVTTDDTDNTVSDQTFNDCTTCLSDGTDVNVWLKCSDDSTAALIDTPHSPTDDYAWLCLSNVWVKCYNWAVEEGTADNPAYLEQCGTTPADCTDLVGWPGSDDFGGTGCNSEVVDGVNYGIRWTETKVGSPTYSIGGALEVDIPDPDEGIPASDSFNGTGTDSGAVGDTNWNTRWTAIDSDGTRAIVSNKLKYNIPSGTDVRETDRNNASIPGAFTAQVTIDWTGITGTLPTAGASQAYLIARTASEYAAVVVGKWGPGGPEYPTPAGGTAYDFQSSDIGSANGAAVSQGTADVMKIVRDGSNNVILHFNGNSLGSANMSGSITLDLWFVSLGGSGTKPAQECIWDDFTLVDGNGDPILISSGSPVTSSIKFTNNIPAQSGDFYAEVDITVDAVTGTGTGPAMELRIDSNTAVGYYQNDSITGWGYQKSGTYTLVTTGLGSKIVAIGRTGSTVSIYIDGSVEDTVTLTGSKTPELFASNDLNATTAQDGITGAFDDFIIEDSESFGDDIYIDPTGDSCP